MYPMTHAGNSTHHLVYVRRKLESEQLPGTSASVPPCGTDSDDSPPPCSIIEPTQKEVEVDVKVPSQASPNSDSHPLEKNSKSPANAHVNCIVTSSAMLDPHKHCWEGRIFQLNYLLNKLDGSDQKDYIEMLRSLSSVELSKHAVELEKRSIQLSLDEGKEIQRIQVLDVLERYSKPSIASSSSDRALSELR
ncbi:OLC1v1003595C1 [Oldenlandia corymbosa var. corymbosa]|uniref:OLC1v1003595C1 n=1 Tax=Oldenlandia corymbosa var. corymbosa TaxID=529605 RepID=A0AAV1DB06_OLDCO|nr:OLC1v1003595C1 [Oldenlandia corymbosa var. corymbosa]